MWVGLELKGTFFTKSVWVKDNQPTPLSQCQKINQNDERISAKVTRFYFFFSHQVSRQLNLNKTLKSGIEMDQDLV